MKVSNYCEVLIVNMSMNCMSSSFIFSIWHAEFLSIYISNVDCIGGIYIYKTRIGKSSLKKNCHADSNNGDFLATYSENQQHSCHLSTYVVI